MKPFLTTVALMSFLLSVQAQTNPVRGVLFEKGSSIRLASARVVNLSSRISVETDRLGVFEISANVGDTLNVTKDGYSELNTVVFSHQDLILYLPKSIRLNEVNVTAQSKRQEMDYVRKQFRKRGSFYAGKPPLLSYIFSPLTALYELVGKTPGQARRFNNYYQNELQQSEIDRRFNSYTLGPITGYEGKDLQNFLDTYRPRYEQISRWNDYDLLNYVKASMKSFEAAGRPAPTALPPLQKDLNLGGS